MDDADVSRQVAAVEELLGQLEELPDAAGRTQAIDAVQGLAGLYGEGLRRILAAVPGAGEALTRDELVSHLLMLHGLHPATVWERVTSALDEVRPYLGSHGGGVELVDVAAGVALVRLEGTCDGCASSTATLKLAIEEAVLRNAPEIAAVEAEGEDGEDGKDSAGAEPAASKPATTLLPMPEVGPPADGGVSAGNSAGNGAPGSAGKPTAGAVRGGWTRVGTASELGVADGPVRRLVADTPMLFAELGGELFAYQDYCLACRRQLAEPDLDGEELRCGGCGRSYDVRHAGQCLDGPMLHLEPVPLLVNEAGDVRVALEGSVA